MAASLADDTSYSGITEYAGIRHQFDEAETPPECGIQQCNRAISSIHRSDHIHVVWNPEWLPCQWEKYCFTTFILLEHTQEFPKDARDISSIDFVDDQIEPVIWPGISILTDFFEDTISQGEMHLTVDGLWSKPFEKIFVSIGWMETTEPNHAVIPKNTGFLFTGQLLKRLAKACTCC